MFDWLMLVVGDFKKLLEDASRVFSAQCMVASSPTSFPAANLLEIGLITAESFKNK